jgi:3-oxoacyl-[acyl-carrier protein] reductase
VDLGLEQRACLVTGGSAGIGLATAVRLGLEGARVAVCGRTRAHLDAADEAIRTAGAADVLTVEADLSRPGGPERAVHEAAERFGGLDVLVNNVGVARAWTWEEVDDAAWDASFAINVMSYVRAARAALPHLRRSTQARIVNVSSTAGKRPSQTLPEYSVMKAAVLSFSRLLADAHAKDGILVNAVCPGPALTDTWVGEGGLADQNAARSGSTREQVLIGTGSGRPIGRMAEPGEIADVIALLCSARASYVAGAAWSVDGGTVPIIV